MSFIIDPKDHSTKQVKEIMDHKCFDDILNL